MQQPDKKYFTPQEYLELEEAAEYKSEYYQGEIFAMAGTSFDHNQIVLNVSTQLHQEQKNHNCRVAMNDLRLWVKEKDLYTYPDIMVICNKPEFYQDRNDTIINPKIIIEVLSESTENYDRGKKFLFYRSIPTFQEYILIDQYSTHIEQFYIGADGNWVLKEYNDLNDVLKFTKIDFQISLKTVYNLIEFE